MNRRASAVLAVILLAAALASSCGSGGTPPGPASGKARPDQAVCARDTPTSAAQDFLAADLTGFERPTDILEFTRLPHLPPVRRRRRKRRKPRRRRGLSPPERSKHVTRDRHRADPPHSARRR